MWCAVCWAIATSKLASRLASQKKVAVELLDASFASAAWEGAKEASFAKPVGIFAAVAGEGFAGGEEQVHQDAAKW